MSPKGLRGKSLTPSKQLPFNLSQSLTNEPAQVQSKTFPPIQTRYLRNKITPSSSCQNLPSTPPLLPQQCETSTSSHTSEVDQKPNHSGLVEGRQICSRMAPQTEKYNNGKVLDVPTEQAHNSSFVMSSASPVLQNKPDTYFILPSPTNSKTVSDIESPNHTIQHPPRAKAFIFKKRAQETLLTYVRKTKACVQIIDFTKSESELDDPATKECDASASFHEHEDDMINIPESNKQMEPEAVRFSLRTELNLLREMRQLESEMMIQEDPIRTELDTKVPTSTTDNCWRFWRRLFGRCKRDKLSNIENITNFSDCASTHAAAAAYTSEEHLNKGSCIKQKDLSQNTSRSICQLVRRLFRKQKRGKRDS